MVAGRVHFRRNSFLARYLLFSRLEQLPNTVRMTLRYQNVYVYAVQFYTYR